MPDVVNFEKEMRRGHVRAVNLPESERGKEKTYAGKGKKRASIQHAAESDVSSDGERERKKRRLNGPKTYNRDDDEGAGITGATSQGTAESPRKGGAKGTKIKNESSDGGFGQVESIPREVVRRLTGSTAGRLWESWPHKSFWTKAKKGCGGIFFFVRLKSDPFVFFSYRRWRSSEPGSG